MKMLKITIIAVISLVILGVIAMAVDYYFYSWSSAVRPFGCEYKTIKAVYKQEKLAQDYDLLRTGELLQPNPNYKFEYPNGGTPYGENWLEVSRMFKDVKYKIRFEKHTNLGKKYTEIEFNNLNFNNYTNSISRSGEEPTTPNYYIKNNIHQMIDEMPLNDAQKNELKSKVWISCSPTAKIGF